MKTTDESICEADEF